MFWVISNNIELGSDRNWDSIRKSKENGLPGSLLRSF